MRGVNRAARSRFGVVALVAAVAVGSSAALWVGLDSGRSIGQSADVSAEREPRPESARRVPAAWLAANIAVGAVVVAPSPLVVPLTSALPGRTVLGNEEPVAAADLAVVRAGAAPPSAAGTGPDGPTVARLARAGLEIRQLIRPGESMSRELEARRSAGRELLSNTALSFSPFAAVVVRAGAVDPRLLTLLAALAQQHTLVVELVADPKNTADLATRRELRVLSLDGRLTARVEAARTDIRDVVLSQPGPLQLAAISSASPNGAPVRVRYPLPIPLGLLEGASFPTTEESP